MGDGQRFSRSQRPTRPIQPLEAGVVAAARRGLSCGPSAWPISPAQTAKAAEDATRGDLNLANSDVLVAEDGTRFEASIPEFTLSVPRVLH